jgi:hypothetical protein
MKLAGADVVYLIVETFVYFIAVFLIERFSSNQLLRSCGEAKDPGVNRFTPDDDVEAEAEVAKNVDP